MGGGSGGGRGVQMAPPPFKANPSHIKYRAYTEGDDPNADVRVRPSPAFLLLGTLLERAFDTPAIDRGRRGRGATGRTGARRERPVNDAPVVSGLASADDRRTTRVRRGRSRGSRHSKSVR